MALVFTFIVFFKSFVLRFHWPSFNTYRC